MKRPILWMLLFFISGVLLGYNMPFGVCYTLFFVLFLGTALILIKHWHSKAPILFFLFFLLGSFLMKGSLAPVDKAVEQGAQENRVVVVEGVITETGTTKSGRQKLTVACIKVMGDTISYNGKVKLYVLSKDNKQHDIWETIHMKGKLLPLEGKRVPGAYDEWLYLKTRGFDYKMFPDSVDVMGKKATPVLRTIFGLKQKIQEVYDEVLPKEESGIIKAMVTGEKEDVDSTLKDLYTRAGITHILAISGLHVSIIALYLFYLLQKGLRLNRRVSSAITIVGLLFYLLFTGFSASAVRAVVMVTVGLFGNILYRSGDRFNNIAIAALVILLVEPLYLWDIGFQLSFVTITGILCGMEMLEKEIRLPVLLKNTVGISFFATLSSYPVTAFHFYSISLVSILTNIVVLPLTGLLLIFGIITGVVGLVSLPFATFFGGTVYYILQFYKVVCGLVTIIPGGYVHLGRPPLLVIIFWYLTFLIIYCYKEGNKCQQIAMLGTGGLFLFCLVGNRLIFHENTVAFLDVGQGDCIVINTYDGKTFVVDGGGKYHVDYGKNTGNTIVLPYLAYMGTDEIDGLFLTHMDMDHGAGVVELMDQIPVKGAYISDYDFKVSQLYLSFLKTVEKNKVPLYTVKAGDRTDIHKDMRLECFYPMDNEISFYDSDDNHGSMVLKLTCDEVSFLLAGDAGIEDEMGMIIANSDLNSDILKAGHHGSKYSSSTEFLEKVSPEVAIFSSGKKNRYGHPHKETIERMEAFSIKRYNTAERGTVTVLTNGKKYKIKTMTGR